jgi:tetratricopeptide (TPR) repeat protein
MDKLRNGVQLAASVVVLAGGIPWSLNEFAKFSAGRDAQRRAQTAADQGRIALEAADVDLAARALGDAVALSPSDAALVSAHARALAAQVLQNEASIEPRNVLRIHRTLDAALAAGERQAEVELALGRIHVYRGQRVEAEKRFQAVVAREPKHARALLYLGDLQFKNDELDNAQTTLRRAIEADPALSLARLVLGQVLLVRESFDEASKLLDAVTRELPRNALAQLAYGRALVGLERWRDAEPALARAINLDPNLRGVYGPLGDACLRNGRLDQALASFKMAYEKDRDLESYKKLGRAYVQMGDLERGSQVFSELKALLPEDPEPHLVLGLSARAAKRPDLARRSWERCVQLAQGRDKDQAVGESCLSLAQALDGDGTTSSKTARPKP